MRRFHQGGYHAGGMNERDRLREAIRRLHGCESFHVGSVAVASIPEGRVEVFALEGHPQATRAYAWSQVTSGGWRCMAVLGLDPVRTAADAVRLHPGADGSYSPSASNSASSSRP
jgi:hypothetical protein